MSKLFIFLKPVGREVKHLPKKKQKTLDDLDD